MSFNHFLSLTSSDLYRYAGSTRLRDFVYHYAFSPGYKYTFWMRLCAYLHAHSLWRIILFPIAWLIYYHYQVKFGIAISHKEQIGYGLYIGHHGGIVTNEQAVIGDNCNLSHEVTIGVTRRGERMGVPQIGDNVYIGPGAKIIGQVKVSVDGYLVPPNEPEQLAQNILLLLDKPEMRNRMGANARAHFLEKFEINQAFQTQIEY
jgi:serine O-acetyltransferase